METKKWYVSKTFWVNLLALAAMFAQGREDLVLDGQTQGIILAAINIILRFITKEKIEW